MSSAAANNRDNRQIARAAATVMVTFVLAKVVGLLFSILLGRTFGASAVVDAFYAANRFSETLFNFVAGGALASAFIPTFTTLLEKDDRQAAWRLASAISVIVTGTLTVVGVLSWIFAPWVVRNVLASGFDDPAQQQLTADLLRVQLPSAVIFGLSGLLMGILNAHRSFFFPALAPALYPLGMIFGVLILAPEMGIYGPAWGVVIGSLLHLVIQIPNLLRLPGMRLSLGRNIFSRAVLHVLALMGPRVVGVGAVQINFWINTLIASGLPEGSITAIQWAFMLMMMPQAAIAQSIAVAALPTFSAQVARGKAEEMRHSLATSLRGVLLLSLPASVGLILLRRPLVATIFENGMFTEQSTSMLAWALMWYAAGLVGHCVVEILSRAFYALHDTRTPVTVGVATMSLNAVLSLLFTRLFASMGMMPHGGLAAANSLATALEMVVLLVLMQRRLKGLEGKEIFRSAVAAIAGSLAMGAALWLLLLINPLSSRVAITVIGIALGGLVYGALLAALRVNEVRQVWGAVTVRLRRKN